MSKDHIEAATQKGVGAMKNAIGKATGNEKLRAEGMADKLIGSAKEAAAKAGHAAHTAEKKHVDRQLDHGLDETFPASDPVSINPGSD